MDSQLNPDDETDVEVLRRLINECAIDRQIEQGDGDANLKDIMKFVKVPWHGDTSVVVFTKNTKVPCYAFRHVHVLAVTSLALVW